MWLFIPNCPISSWSQGITVVLTWLLSVPLFYRDIIVANWHQTRGTSGLQLVRSSWGLLPWGNGQWGERCHLCRWDMTLTPRIPVKWDLDKRASYVLSPDSSGQEQKWVVFAVAVVCSCICSISELWTGALLCQAMCKLGTEGLLLPQGTHKFWVQHESTDGGASKKKTEEICQY